MDAWKQVVAASAMDQAITAQGLACLIQIYNAQVPKDDGDDFFTDGYSIWGAFLQHRTVSDGIDGDDQYVGGQGHVRR